MLSDELSREPVPPNHVRVSRGVRPRSILARVRPALRLGNGEGEGERAAGFDRRHVVAEGILGDIDLL